MRNLRSALLLVAAWTAFCPKSATAVDIEGRVYNLPNKSLTLIADPADPITVRAFVGGVEVSNTVTTSGSYTVSVGAGPGVRKVVELRYERKKEVTRVQENIVVDGDNPTTLVINTTVPDPPSRSCYLVYQPCYQPARCHFGLLRPFQLRCR